WVIHAAGMLGRAGVAETYYHQLHVEGTRHVLAEIASMPGTLPRVLYVSSPGVLGPITGKPAGERAPLAPSNRYERSKAAAEQVAYAFAREGLPVIIARPEFIHGPGDTHVLGLFRAVQRGLFFYVGNGQNTCHPTFIDDAVDGLLRCLRYGQPGAIYHVTGPEPVTFRHLAETVAMSLGVPPPRLAVPRPIAWLVALTLEGLGKVSGKEPPLSRTGVAFFSEDRRFSWQKAHRELGYTPRFDLQTGVRKTVTWYREQGLL
ncbi:MAG TPA: NAD-dependent epimerase/dehydratase family protein, partial [Anaerolineae bacterium]